MGTLENTEFAAPQTRTEPTRYTVKLLGEWMAFDSPDLLLLPVPVIGSGKNSQLPALLQETEKKIGPCLSFLAFQVGQEACRLVFCHA